MCKNFHPFIRMLPQLFDFVIIWFLTYQHDFAIIDEFHSFKLSSMLECLKNMQSTTFILTLVHVRHWELNRDLALEICIAIQRSVFQIHHINLLDCRCVSNHLMWFIFRTIRWTKLAGSKCIGNLKDLYNGSRRQISE